MSSGAQDVVDACRPYFDAVGSNVFYYGADPGNSQAAKLINNLILGINMNAVAEGLKFGAAFGLPESELVKLFAVSTADSWDAVSAWTAETALSVLLKDLVAAHSKGLKYNVPLPFNALSSTLLFDSMGVQPPAVSRG